MSNVINVFSTLQLSPLEKGMISHLNKPEFFPMHTLYQVCWKFTKYFWKIVFNDVNVFP